MSLLLLVDILDDYSEMPLSNVVGDVNYVLLVQIYVSQLQYIMALNGLDCQIKFLNTFFPIKDLNFLFLLFI